MTTNLIITAIMMRFIYQSTKMDSNLLRLIQTLKDVDRDYEDIPDDVFYKLYIVWYNSWKKWKLKDFILSNKNNGE